MDLTEEIILQHGRHSPFKGKIKNATKSIEIQNSLCGDKLWVDIKIDQDKISEMAFSGSGCLISQACASLLIGEISRVKKISKVMKFNEDTIHNLLGFKPTLSRRNCALLILQVLKRF